MNVDFSDSQRLPSLRKDLQLFRGPDDSDGSPTYNVYDPVRAKYFKISWAEAAILENIHPDMTAGELIAALTAHTTLKVTLSELTLFFQDAARQGLLEKEHAVEELVAEATKAKLNPIKAFLLYYLFFRIPLVNPDAFLTRTIDRVRFLLTPLAFKIYLAIWFWGMAAVAVQWDAFFATFSYFFSVEGFVAYMVAIAATKTVHEFAHAYTAKRYGLRIPTMGIAFLVLFPVLYTDVTDAWRLASRRKRMLISAAGIIAELTIAAIASILWAYSSPGIIQSVLFVLASANWIQSLAININPALRFDGYYLLMDWLGVENLQPRAFQLFRYSCYRVLLGIPMPDTEPKLSKGLKRFLVVYAIYTFLYRLFLYTAIALFVYYEFTKTVGIFLFATEILLFFIWPVVSEIAAFRTVRHLATINERSATLLGIVTILLFWVVVPLPHTLSFNAISVAVDDRSIYAPIDARIKEVKVERFSTIKQGQELLVLESKELSNKLSSLQTQAQVIQKKLDVVQGSQKLLSYYAEKQAELARVQAEADGVARQIDQLRLVSDEDGYVYAWDEHLLPGQYISKDQLLGHVAKKDKLDVVCYVPERDIEGLHLGQEVTFRINSSSFSLHGVIKRISPVRALSLTYPQLASLNGGPLAVADAHKKELPLLESYFPVVISLKERAGLAIGQEGIVFVRGPWNSYLMRLLDAAFAILWQEGNA